MLYYKHIETSEVYAYTQADIDVAAGIADLELVLSNSQAALDALPEPTDTDEPDAAREAAERAVKDAQRKLDDVLPVFFDIREKLKGMTELTGTELEAHLNPKPTDEQLAEQARFKRDRLLSESDWTQAPDAPVDQAAWAAYRQALRDVPQQEGFPTDINWPEQPE